jgi:phosphoserine phosphatase
MRLLVVDVEGTLFKTSIKLPGTSIDSTIWQSIAQALGSQAVKEEVATHRKWELGEYKNYLEWMEETIEIHRRYGLSQLCFSQLIASAEYNPGVVETLSKIERSNYEIVLVSGGFRELAARAQQDCFIRHAFAACEYFFEKSGRLSWYNLMPCDFEGKLDFIQLMLREYQLADADWVFVGDGANDVHVAKEAPLSVGYRPHRDLKSVVTESIDNFQDLLVVLDR